VTPGDIAQIGANTLLGNATASTANLAALSMPSCSAATSALTWTAAGGFGCNSITGSGGGITNAGDVLADTKPTGTLISRKTEYTAVAGSATQTILDYSGAGYVSSLFVAVAFSNGASTDAGLINIYYDGEVTPTISMTLPQFFQMVYMRGSAAPNDHFNSRFFGANFDGTTNTAGSFYTTLPIPFASRIKVDIVNGSSSAMTMWSVSTLQTGITNNWSRTRKLRVATQFINAPSANSTQTIVNIAGKGRLVGLWMLADDFPNTMNPVGAEWEGNFRFYLDNAAKVWAATTAYSLADTVIDSNGNKQTVTTAGTSGGSAPTWSQASGGTTSDGSVTWTQTPGSPNQVWRASKPFALNMALIDGNGFVQRVTTAGTSGSSAPTFNSTAGATTTDGTVTWTNQGSTYVQAGYQSSGSEDYFMAGFYGQGWPAMSSSSGLLGTTFVLTSPMTPSSLTRSFYRYHILDPITFDQSLVITWQAGDTSQISWTSGTPRVWITAYYYTEN
jgi:hypothetical protein